MADFIPFDQVIDDITPSDDGLPSFIPFDMVVDDVTPSASREPTSVSNEILGVGNKFVEGAADLLDLGGAVGRNLNPFQMGGPRLFGLNENIFNAPPASAPSEEVKDAARSVLLYGDEKPQTALGKVLGETAYALPSAVIPGGGASLAARGGAAALSGGASGVASLFTDNPFIQGAAGLVPGAVKSAVGGLSNIAREAAKKSDRLSLGTTAADFTRSQRLRGLIDADDAAGAQTRLAEAIDEIAATEGLGFRRGAATLLDKNQNVLDEVGAQIGGVLNKVDEVGIVPSADRLVDEASATQRVISTAKAERKDIEKAFGEFMDRFTDPATGWNGTVSDLNKWKSSAQRMAFSGSAEGTLRSDSARKLQRAIQYDLQSAVDDAVSKSGVISPDDWHQTLRRYSNRAEINPLLERGVAKAEADTAEKGLRQAIRTSGGYLTSPTLIASALGGAAGGVPGLLGGALLGLAGTQTGRGVTASTLRGASRAGDVVARNSKEALRLGLANLAVRSTLPQEQQFDERTTPLQAEAQLPLENLRSQLSSGSPDISPRLATGPESPQTRILPRPSSSHLGTQPSLNSTQTPETRRSISQLPVSTGQSGDAAALQMAMNVLNRGGVPMEQVPPIQAVESQDEIAPLVEAVIQQESAGNPEAVSEVGAQGLMQIMPETAKDIAKELGVEDYDLKDPETNRLFGTHYLKKLIDQFNGDVPLALTAYHSGPGRVEKLLKKTGGSSLEDIIDLLGPVGRKYATGVLAKLSTGTVNV